MKCILITSTSERPLSDLILAINLYVSTGNRVGECMALRGRNGVLDILILCNRESPQDVKEFGQFRARIEELREAGYPVTLTSKHRVNRFDAWELRVAEKHVLGLAAGLINADSEERYGAASRVVLQHFRDRLNQVLFMELQQRLEGCGP